MGGQGLAPAQQHLAGQAVVGADGYPQRGRHGTPGTPPKEAEGSLVGGGGGLAVKCHLALTAQVAVSDIDGGDAGAARQQLVGLTAFPFPGSRQLGGLWGCCGCRLGGLGWWLEEGIGEQPNEGLRYHRVHGEQPLLHAVKLLEVGPL